MPANVVSGLRQVLGRRLGPYVALADFDDGVTEGLTSLGVVPADRFAVVDGDFATVLGPQLRQVLDVAEWRMLETIIANCTADEFRKVGLSNDPDKAILYLTRRLNMLWARIQKMYSIGLPTLSTGVLDLNSLQQDDGNINY